MRVRKKPVIVDAIKWTGYNFKEVYKFMNGNYPTINSRMASDRWQDYVDTQITKDRKLKLKTLGSDEKYQVADIGDWIIKGVNGEFYPCKSDIFKKTYEIVEEK